MPRQGCWSRTTVGTRYTPETMRLAVESERRLAAAPEIPRRPKLRFIILDPGAPAPGPKEREQFSKLAVDRRMPRLLGHVSDSIVTRAAFSVVSALRGSAFAPQERAFATREAAIGWFEGRRSGVRAPLLALLAKVDAQVDRERGARSGALAAVLSSAAAVT
jgi:hypothetical protein